VFLFVKKLCASTQDFVVGTWQLHNGVNIHAVCKCTAAIFSNLKVGKILAMTSDCVKWCHIKSVRRRRSRSSRLLVKFSFIRRTT